MLLFLVNALASMTVLVALTWTVRRPLPSTQESRAVVVLLATILALSGVGVLRRLEATFADAASLAAWTAVAAVAAWVVTRPETD